MKVVLLIGFQYDFTTPPRSTSSVLRTFRYADRRSKEIVHGLPGIIVDLYQAYVFARATEPDRICILTDIMEDAEEDSAIFEAITERSLDANVMSFIRAAQQQGIYSSFKDVETFQRKLENLCHGADQVFVYYTGHAIGDDLILPVRSSTTSTKLPLEDFRRSIIEATKPQAQLFFVMDCCNGPSMNLPFEWVVPKAHLVTSTNPRPQYRLRRDIDPLFTQRQVVCLSSSRRDQVAVTTRLGSIFTYTLFQWLPKLRSLGHLIEKISREIASVLSDDIDGRQTASLYVSHPNIHMTWSWLFHQGGDRIRIDPAHSCIFVR